MINSQLLQNVDFGRFWPILAKMGTPKNGEMWFLMKKSCLVSKNNNRNQFL
jgi:hypothetical protein